MTYKQLREVLGAVQRVHAEAAGCCTDVRDTPDERLRLLADFFRRQEDALGQRLTTSGPPEAPEMPDVLDTWVQFVPTKRIDDALTALCAARDRGASATLKRCLDLQGEIVEFFRQLAENLDAPRAREMLRDLAESEHSGLRQLGLADTMQKDA